MTLDASSSSQLVSGPAAGRAPVRGGPGDHPPRPAHPVRAAYRHDRGHADGGRRAGGDRPHARPAADVPDFWRVRPGRLAPGTIAIEPDLSNAAPFLAAALVTGGRVTIPGWPARSLQAAGQIMDVLGQMGARWAPTPDAACASRAPARSTASRPTCATSTNWRPCSPRWRRWPTRRPSSPGSGTCACTRVTGWPRSPPRSAPSAVRSPSCPTACACSRGRCAPAPDPFDSHDDHRLVMAGGRARARRAWPARRQRGHRRQDIPRVPGALAADAGAGTLTRPVSHARLDEDDVRVRPGKGSRPRTRRRPAHEDAIDAFVTGVDRGRYHCWTGERMITAMKAQGTGPSAASWSATGYA